MTLVEEYTDVVALKMPLDIDPERDSYLDWLNTVAERSVWIQWNGVKDRPDAIIVDRIDWLVTSSIEDVEKFQPAHDCPTCLAANDQMIAYLREFPGNYIAMGNMTYREEWG